MPQTDRADADNTDKYSFTRTVTVFWTNKTEKFTSASSLGTVRLNHLKAVSFPWCGCDLDCQMLDIKWIALMFFGIMVLSNRLTLNTFGPGFQTDIPCKTVP